MDRFVLTDAQWAKMEPHCLGKSTDPRRSVATIATWDDLRAGQVAARLSAGSVPFDIDVGSHFLFSRGTTDDDLRAKLRSASRSSRGKAS